MPHGARPATGPEVPARPGAPAGDDGGPCPNCGSPVVLRYCAECGQERPRADDFSLVASLREHGTDVLGLDGRAGRTLRALLARPGLLTADYLQGRRARYLKPMQLFLIVNVIFFLLAPRAGIFSYSLENYLRFSPPSAALAQRWVQGELRRTGESLPQYTARFDDRLQDQRKSLIILFVPFFALLMRALYARSGRRYGEHLTFSLHFFAFLWLVIAALALLGRVAPASLDAGRTLTALFLVLAVPVHLFLALRRVYVQPRAWTLARTVVLLAGFAALLSAYRALLFFTTYFSL